MGVCMCDRERERMYEHVCVHVCECFMVPDLCTWLKLSTEKPQFIFQQKGPLQPSGSYSTRRVHIDFMLKIYKSILCLYLDCFSKNMRQLHHYRFLNQLNGIYKWQPFWFLESDGHMNILKQFRGIWHEIISVYLRVNSTLWGNDMLRTFWFKEFFSLKDVFIFVLCVRVFAWMNISITHVFVLVPKEIRGGSWIT